MGVVTRAERKDIGTSTELYLVPPYDGHGVYFYLGSISLAVTYAHVFGHQLLITAQNVMIMAKSKWGGCFHGASPHTKHIAKVFANVWGTSFRANVEKGGAKPYLLLLLGVCLGTCISIYIYKPR